VWTAALRVVDVAAERAADGGEWITGLARRALFLDWLRQTMARGGRRRDRKRRSALSEAGGILRDAMNRAKVNGEGRHAFCDPTLALLFPRKKRIGSGVAMGHLREDFVA
jgi:hypothetical protein